MARARAFKQVDVFTAVPLKGNPVAVVLDGEGLSDAEMQATANWTNLSETTFVLPPATPGADYRVRIFTPRSELPFAGHPTLGTAHAVIEAGLVAPRNGQLVQESAVGLVDVMASDSGLSFRLPAHRFEAAPAPDVLLAAMQAGGAVQGTPRIVNVGPRWVIAELASVADVEAFRPDLAALAAYDRAHGTTGLTIYAPGQGRDILVRSFAPADGLMEDPVCGSGNGAVAADRLDKGHVRAGDAYRASQGRQVGRDGDVRIRIAEDGIHVGGQCVTCIDGHFRL